MNRQQTRQSNQQAGQRALLSPKAGDVGHGKAVDGIEGFLPLLRRRGWIFGLFLVAATMIAYLPVWHAGFIWDDDLLCTNNQLIKSPHGWYQLWITTKTPDYFPVMSSFFWLEWRLWGMNATGYHVVNVLLHAANAILFWRLLARLKIPCAMLAAAIFALHPANAESVAWMAQLKNTLSLFFSVLSLLWYLKFDEAGRWRCYWLAWGAFLFALWSKIEVAPLPFVLLGLAWWRRGRVDWKDLRNSIPFFAVAFVLGLVSVWFQYHVAIGHDVVRADSFWSRLAGAGWAVWFYLGKTLLPLHLTPVYPRWHIDPTNPLSYVPGLLVVACFLVFWRYRGAWGKPLLFGLGYAVVMFLPVLGFLNIYFFRYSFVSDHYQYFSIIGPIALVSAALTRVSGFLEKQNVLLKPLFCGSLLAVLGVLTWQEAAVYKNPETLWRTSLDRNPACWVASENLGDILLKKGKVNEAIAQLQRTLAINPDDAVAYNNIGNALLQKGQVDEAMTNYQKALTIDPSFAFAHYNLADVLLQEGRVDEGIAQLQEALAILPDFVEAHNNLGNVLLQRGDTDEAIAHFQKALAFQPDYAAAHYDLGNALLQKGRVDEAIIHYQRALAIQPNYAKAHNNLGTALLQKGQVDEAIVHFQKALALQPDFAQARDNLTQIAWLLATSPYPSVRNGTKAVELAQQTDRLSGGTNPMMAATLAAAYAETGRFSEAITNAQRAERLAASQNNAALAASIEAQLKLYQAGTPFHQPDASH